MPSQPFNPDQELAEFFTDVECLRDSFKKSVDAPTLTKRLLVIHGVGGVGKSPLLRMFRLHCKSVNVPVALASGDEAKSALDVLACWTDDLKADGVAFSAFGKTFEQMTALDDWAREVAQRLHTNVLFVIAGRALPNWSRAWDSWQKHAHVEELKPMTEDVIRDLVRRYYATMRGSEPDLKQVEAIIRFARGLPMVVTGAVQLWVKYGVEDFQAVKAEIVANLVDRLMEGVPKELIPALEAAAIVRWFDQPILRAVTKQDDVRDVYNQQS